jgi:hypothetical protein
MTALEVSRQVSLIRKASLDGCGGDRDPRADQRPRASEPDLDLPGVRRQAVGGAEGSDQAIAPGAGQCLELGQRSTTRCR